MSFRTSVALPLSCSTYYALPYILVICVHHFLPNYDCKILWPNIQIYILHPPTQILAQSCAQNKNSVNSYGMIFQHYSENSYCNLDIWNGGGN